MDISLMNLRHAALLFALPASLAGVCKLAWRRGEEIEYGWFAILFIALCLGVALESILGRLL